VGGGLLLLQMANRCGYVSINWRKINRDIKRSKKHLPADVTELDPEVEGQISKVDCFITSFYFLLSQSFYCFLCSCSHLLVWLGLVRTTDFGIQNFHFSPYVAAALLWCAWLTRGNQLLPKIKHCCQFLQNASIICCVHVTLSQMPHYSLNYCPRLVLQLPLPLRHNSKAVDNKE